MRSVVLGLGVSGKAAVRLLLREGHEVIGADRRFQELENDESIISFQKDSMKLISDIEWPDAVHQLIVSPGIPSTHFFVQKARSLKIPVFGEAELALRHLANRAVAITGTNGKTTTTLLLTHFLKSAGLKARALGNIGHTLSDALFSLDPEEILVVELSSFQLESLQGRFFEAGAILNITPNHLNWHPDFFSYAKAKLHLQDCLKEKGKLFVSTQVQREFGSFLSDFTLFDREKIAQNFDLSYTRRGLPEMQNIQAALMLAEYFGILPRLALQSVETFQKLPHRIEWVADIEGVSYFNDSKASNVEAVLHAVHLLEGPLIVIVGGVHKGSSYVPWKKAFQKKVKHLFGIGEAKHQMQAELSSDFPFGLCDNLEEAVWRAHNMAKEKDTVLLSPGCSSYDQFKSFEERGEKFKQIVKKWDVTKV